ncbi:hypothetical protein [Streptomyces sp. SID13031]|uniref:hypothetical protein n=1 Tax=Streptomyces sp. SID13031 TaxID=2706046 RepID=UPI0013CB8C4B|nr:hypothetical protein [Streptomyces sp. SID13031]NEA32137.1 hypothetical protein [Streptomyces sp. SID13031]
MSEASHRHGGQRRKYPSLNLEQAIERARVLFERERYNAAPIDLVARHWGFKTIKTGPASTAYSAVKQFGLLDETGSGDQRKASISQRARAILTAPEDVRRSEIREAALEPTMNRQIWERYGIHTGSPETFNWHLISEMGFSDTGAREFAKQYEATIHFAGLMDEEFPASVETDRDDLGSLDSSAASNYPVAPTVDVWQASTGERVEVPVHHTPSTVRPSRHAIPLVGGKVVILEGEFPLTEAAWQGFMTVLQAFKPGLVQQDQSLPSSAAAFDES